MPPLIVVPPFNRESATGKSIVTASVLSRYPSASNVVPSFCTSDTVFIWVDTVLNPVPGHVMLAVVWPLAFVAETGCVTTPPPVEDTTMYATATPDLGLRQVSCRVMVIVCGVLMIPMALPVTVELLLSADILPGDTVTVVVDVPVLPEPGSVAVKVTLASA